MKIGIDFGGVLTDTTTPPDKDYLLVAPRANALEVLNVLQAEDHELSVISKAGDEDKEEKAKNWLDYYGFTNLLGKNALHFCRAQEGKIELCEQLGTEVMIDDTPQQLNVLEGIVPVRFLFGAKRSKEFEVVPTWQHVERAIAAISTSSLRRRL